MSRPVRKNSPDAGFEPLTDDGFAELEKLGKVKLSPEARAKLNESLAEHCRVGEARFVRKEARDAAKLVERLEKDLCRVLETLKKIEAAARSGEPLALWQLFPAGRAALGDGRLSASELMHWRGSKDDARRVLESLAELARHGSQALKPEGKGRGRRPNIWLGYFILIIANAYAAAGKKPSAAYQQALGRRETPFLRVLRAIHERLPSNRRAASNSALDELAAEAFRLWREWRNNQGENSR